MGFRNQMRGRESVADIKLIQTCNILFKSGELKERAQSQRRIILGATYPDQQFTKAKVAFFQDGEQVHKRPERDRGVDDQLVHLRWFVIRLRYRAPMRKKRERQIQQVICQVVDWRLRLTYEERKGGRLAQYGPDYEWERLEPELEASLKEILT